MTCRGKDIRVMNEYQWQRVSAGREEQRYVESFKVRQCTHPVTLLQGVHGGTQMTNHTTKAIPTLGRYSDFVPTIYVQYVGLIGRD